MLHMSPPEFATAHRSAEGGIMQAGTEARAVWGRVFDPDQPNAARLGFRGSVERTVELLSTRAGQRPAPTPSVPHRASLLLMQGRDETDSPAVENQHRRP